MKLKNKSINIHENKNQQSQVSSPNPQYKSYKRDNPIQGKKKIYSLIIKPNLFLIGKKKPNLKNDPSQPIKFATRAMKQR